MACNRSGVRAPYPPPNSIFICFLFTSFGVKKQPSFMLVNPQMFKTAWLGTIEDLQSRQSPADLGSWFIKNCSQPVAKPFTESVKSKVGNPQSEFKNLSESVPLKAGRSGVRAPYRPPNSIFICFLFTSFGVKKQPSFMLVNPQMFKTAWLGTIEDLQSRQSPADLGSWFTKKPSRPEGRLFT